MSQQEYSKKRIEFNKPAGPQLPLDSPLMGVSRKAYHSTMSKILVTKQLNITPRMKNVELKDFTTETWNVQTLYRPGNLLIAIMELERYRLDIIAI